MTAQAQAEELREQLLSQMDLSRELSDGDIREMIDDFVLKKSRAAYMTLSQKQELGQELFNALRKLDILQELVDDTAITEIMINGTENIFIEKKGKIFLWEKKFQSRGKLEDLIQNIVAKSNRIVNEANPIVDTRLENGARVNVVLAPVALNGPIVTIRKFPDQPIQMEDLLRWDALTQEADAFLRNLVIAGYNIFLCGGTGCGKTTFLNALSNYIPKDERVITIEDSAELQIQGLKNLVRMETRNANVEGKNEITIRDLIKTSLRMRPDRIIIGEVRGGEAMDLLQAMNTGHDGCLSTGHGNSPVDMLTRLETMVLMGMDLPVSAIRRQIASAIDILVFLGRLRDKSRRVLSIMEVTGYEQDAVQCEPIYQFQETGGGKERVTGILQKVGSLKNTHKLKAAGLLP